jgi:Zn-dependent protease with chaperone function
LKYPYLFYLICFSYLLKVNAQAGAFQPENIELLKSKVEILHENFLEGINGSNANKIKKYYKDFDVNFLKQIEEGDFWFDKEMQDHLEQILVKVYASNSEFNRNDHLWLINKSLIPNAACYGNGIFSVNAGLFLQNSSDDEIAFVICHELAHLKKEHSLKRITSIVETLNSDETKDKIKTAKRKRYGSTRAGLAVLDDLSTGILDHSKEAENEADIIGFDLYQNTNYHKTAVTSSLSKLGDYDNRMESYKVRLDTIFSTKTYPFKKYWIEKSTSLFDKEANTDDFSMKSDTLKTHPDIKQRVETLQNILSNTDEYSRTKESIDLNTENIKMRILQMGIDSGQLDFSLFAILTNFEFNRISKSQYSVLVNQLLLKLADLKKNHELGKYVTTYKNDSDYLSINEIRNFLYNISFKNTTKLQAAFKNENL